jgi:phosphonate transport system permease protein
MQRSSSDQLTHTEAGLGASSWKLKPPFDARILVAAISVMLLLGMSAERLGLGRAASQLGDFALATAGMKSSSQVGDGLGSAFSGMFPLRIDEETPVDRVADLDEALSAPFARLETRLVDETILDPQTLDMVTKPSQQAFLIEPGGYLFFVLIKMAETIEIAIWSTLIAVLISLPLSIFCTRTFAPHLAVYGLSRALVSLLRSIPELISALFLVLAFGFGAVAGIAALALHSIGFLAKFYADDMEAADRRPQEAIAATGAGWFSVLRFAVLPQVLPSYTALTLYILDRNIRMATVIGLVGAGGIGQELKGRYDMFQYDRVGTILLAIFITVLALDFLSARVRRTLI